MLLDRLKARHQQTITVPEWDSEQITIVKLSVRQRLQLNDNFKSRERDENGKLAETADAIEFTIELLACSIRLGDGSPFDSDEGRAYLASESMDLLKRLGDIAIDVNGFLAGEGAEKKTE